MCASCCLFIPRGIHRIHRWTTGGILDSPEVAKTKVAAFALLPRSNTTRWTPHRKAKIVAAVRSGVVSLNEACHHYKLTSDEFASWQRFFENHGVAGLRVTRLQDYRTNEHGRTRPEHGLLLREAGMPRNHS